MGKLTYIMLLSIVIFSTIAIQSKVSATSWVELEPQEVLDRAEVIVTGKYDFSSKPKPSKFIFQGYQFNVNKVHKGDNIPDQLTVGIDGFDIGWTEEFQDDGGEFLLFLEKTENADFLVPVAGPNGMIQLSNGKVQNRKDEHEIFYENVLKEKPEEPFVENKTAVHHEQNSKTYLFQYVIVGVLVAVFLFILFYRRIRKK